MQETQLQQKEILAEKKENISKKSMHKKIILISSISILGIFLLIIMAQLSRQKFNIFIMN